MHFIKSFKLAAITLLVGLVSAAYANNDAILGQLRANLAEKPSAVRESLLPGIYGVYFESDEPRTFVDANLTILGNQSTGYTYLSGRRRGQDIDADESRRLFSDFLAAIPRDRLIAYRFGNGKHEVFLFTAYDCPACRALEKELRNRASTLDATVYVVPTSLSYRSNAKAKTLIRSVQCADNREATWAELIAKGQLSTAPVRCLENPDDYAFLSRSFPVKFPATFPSAVTTDGRVYQTVLRQFDEVFRGR